ncbi:hypothetical protein T4D_1119 [Trichinella pseudospiralis]|uniref:Uncharacterized protein n=1 Tax=Trichinella pseudospiralis TaxID=6337 RepID=A0A0V1FP72_TRIPS|nr:hypothetical protein T4D_1119 [Trichinella pseudospiralis]
MTYLNLTKAKIVKEIIMISRTKILYNKYLLYTFGLPSIVIERGFDCHATFSDQSQNDLISVLIICYTSNITVY